MVDKKKPGHSMSTIARDIVKAYIALYELNPKYKVVPQVFEEFCKAITQEAITEFEKQGYEFDE